MGSNFSRQIEDQKLKEAEDLFLREYGTSHLTRSRTFDGYRDWIRCNLVWQQWEESGKWEWEEQKRYAWAEKLWKMQHIRRITANSAQEELENEK